MLNYVELDPIEEMYVKDWINRLVDKLGFDINMRKMNTFNYLEKHYYENSQNATDLAISILVGLKALELSGHGLHRESSEYKNFIQHIEYSFPNQLNNILEGRDNPCNEFFVLLCTIDTLYSMKINPEIFIKILKKTEPSFIASCQSCPGLTIYSHELNDKLDLSVNLKPISKDVKPKHSAFLSFYYLKKNESVDQKLLDNAKDYKYLWWIAKSWDKLCQNNSELVYILPCSDRLNLDEVIELTWGDMQKIQSTSITNDELLKVTNFNDEDVKNTLYKYFVTDNNLTPSSLGNLHKEKDKSHGGGEISDFNLELKYRNAAISLGFPIKSGRESQGNANKFSAYFIYLFLFIYLIIHV